MIIGPQSGSPSAWSWFSIRVEKVGVAPSGLGARAVRNRSLECHGFRRTASLRTTSNGTTSRRTTSARKTSRLELIERSFGERFLSNSRARRTTSRRTTSHQRLTRTAKTNLESLLLDRLLLHLCVLARAHRRKGSLPRLCGERVLLRVIDTLRLIGFGLPSTNQAQGEYTRSIMEHASQRV